MANAQTLGRIDNFNFNLEDPLKEAKPVVPILRFIDTQNPDGSYTYGYESGDGTYKVVRVRNSAALSYLGDIPT